MSRMTGHASPLNSVYRFANGVFAPGSLCLYLTRCRYATLALMARNAGDLSFKSTPRRLRRRMGILIEYGLVRSVPRLGRYELTASGWNLLNDTEQAWRLSTESN